MEMIEAIKLDREFLEYFDNAITALIPKATLEFKTPERLKMIERFLKGMMIGNETMINKAPSDWISILRIAIRHYEPEMNSTVSG